MNKTDAYSEDFIIWLWENKALQTQPLTAIDGRQFRIIYRGERNLDAGPDFVNVTLEQDQQLLHGCIEVHVESGDWYLHGHQTDAVYNQVVLHLVLNHAGAPPETRREDGVVVPIVLVTPHLTEPLPTLLPRFQKWQQFLSANKPACLQPDMQPDWILARLDRAGAARLTLKALAYRDLRLCNTWDQILYIGIMEALGYSKNQIPFRKLAGHLPIEFILREIRSAPKAEIEIKIQGLLFGAAGLLPRQNPNFTPVPDGETQAFYSQLESVWEEFRHRIGLHSMHPEEWKFFRLRPQNFPTHRLAGMSRLLIKFYESGLFVNLLRVFTGLNDAIDSINRELELLLICESFGFWENHYRFESTRQRESRKPKINLIGSDRAGEVIINVIFPLFLLCAHERGDGRLEAIVKECYRRYPPLAENSITREMTRKLFPTTKNRSRWVSTAQKQQGLIYLYKNYCSRKKCLECYEF